MYYTYIHTKVLLLSCYTMAKNEKHIDILFFFFYEREKKTHTYGSIGC